MLSKLSKIRHLDSCIAQKTAKNSQLSKLSKTGRLDSSEKPNVFNAIQLSKLSTPLKGGLGALHSPYPNPFGVAPSVQAATHHPTCDYWLDLYPWECTCGATGGDDDEAEEE